MSGAETSLKNRQRESHVSIGSPVFDDAARTDFSRENSIAYGAYAPEPIFPWWLRLILFAVGATIVALLATAVYLKPSPNGYGTHRQLGLPPCTMVRFFDMRCPSCGMTTSWTYLVRGRLIAAQQANTGGLLLGLAAMFTGPWLMGTALKGRWFLVIPREAYVVGIGAAIVLATLADWAVRLSLDN